MKNPKSHRGPIDVFLEPAKPGAYDRVAFSGLPEGGHCRFGANGVAALGAAGLS
jgi:hypothetical protein